MSLNQDTLDRLDDGFNSARVTKRCDGQQAVNLLAVAVKTAGSDENAEVAKARLQRAYCLATEVLKSFDADDESESTEIELPADMLEEVEKDTKLLPRNMLPMSSAIQSLAKRFGSPEVDPEPTQKSADEPTFDSGVDLNAEAFDSNTVDWGPDPDFSGN